MLIESIVPLRVKLPEGNLQLWPGQPVDLPEDRAKKLLEKAPGKVHVVAPLLVVEHGYDPYSSILAVRIASPIVGEFWLVLSETEPFTSGDNLPVYRPAEIRALRGKGYGPHDLAAVHRAKQALDGTIIR